MSSIIYEDENVQIVETITENGRTVETLYKPGSVLANNDLLRKRAGAALAGNRTFLEHAPYPASPTTAQRDAAINLLIGQVDALTRQVSALIRLELGELDDISDT